MLTETLMYLTLKNTKQEFKIDVINTEDLIKKDVTLQRFCEYYEILSDCFHFDVEQKSTYILNKKYKNNIIKKFSITFNYISGFFNNVVKFCHGKLWMYCQYFFFSVWYQFYKKKFLLKYL